MSGFDIKLDTTPCLPDPIAPDKDRYIEIGILVFASILLTIIEPYGLRIRQHVMRSYYPYRTRQRAVWLYNKISRHRDNFLTRTRRRLRRKALALKTTEKGELGCCSNFKSTIAACLPDWMSSIFGVTDDYSKLGKTCLLCGLKYKRGKMEQFYKCPTPQCPGLYCQPCFDELRHVCTICQEPGDYGDFSDIDIELDSSDDENHPGNLGSKKRKRKKCRKDKCEDQSVIEEEKQVLLSVKLDSQRQRAGLDKKITSSTSSSSTESSNSDTDLSYSYQYQENYTSNAARPMKISISKDVEKQSYPDQVTMQIFNECLGTDTDGNIILPSKYCIKDIVLRKNENQRNDIPNPNVERPKTTSSDDGFSESEITIENSEIILQKFFDSLNNETLFNSNTNISQKRDDSTNDSDVSGKRKSSKNLKTSSTSTTSIESTKVLLKSSKELQKKSSLFDVIKTLFTKRQSSSIIKNNNLKSSSIISDTPDISSQSLDLCIKPKGNSTPSSEFPDISSWESADYSSFKSRRYTPRSNNDTVNELLELINLEDKEDFSARKTSKKSAESYFIDQEQNLKSLENESKKENFIDELFFNQMEIVKTSSSSENKTFSNIYFDDNFDFNVPNTSTSSGDSPKIKSNVQSRRNIPKFLSTKILPKIRFTSEKSTSSRSEPLSKKPSTQNSNFSQKFSHASMRSSNRSTKTSPKLGAKDINFSSKSSSDDLTLDFFTPRERFLVDLSGISPKKVSPPINDGDIKRNDQEPSKPNENKTKLVLTDSSSSTSDTVENIAKLMDKTYDWDTSETSNTEDTELKFRKIFPRPK